MRADPKTRVRLLFVLCAKVGGGEGPEEETPVRNVSVCLSVCLSAAAAGAEEKVLLKAITQWCD